MKRILEDLRQLEYVEYAAIGVGGVLLVFGRRLYWLVLGALGFWPGLLIANEGLNLSYELELGAAFLAGIVGAVAAIVAQKLAVRLGGFVIGAVAAYLLAQPWAADLAYQIWWVALLGGVVGLFFAAALFDAALIVFSSIVGAALIADALPLVKVHQTWTFLGLAALGIVIQTRERSKKNLPKDE